MERKSEIKSRKEVNILRVTSPSGNQQLRSPNHGSPEPTGTPNRGSLKSTETPNRQSTGTTNHGSPESTGTYLHVLTVTFPVNGRYL